MSKNNFYYLAATGTLLSTLMILFGLFSSSYLPENTAESFIFLSPLPLAFTMISFHHFYAGKKGNIAVFTAGAIGIGQSGERLG